MGFPSPLGLLGRLPQEIRDEIYRNVSPRAKARCGILLTYPFAGTMLAVQARHSRHLTGAFSPRSLRLKDYG